jgi:hypothetical protein
MGPSVSCRSYCGSDEPALNGIRRNQENHNPTALFGTEGAVMPWHPWLEHFPLPPAGSGVGAPVAVHPALPRWGLFRLSDASIHQLSSGVTYRMAINMSWRLPTADWAIEKTDNPLYTDNRDFCKVEKWMRDGVKVERMLYDGNNLGRAQEIFASAIKHRPRIRLTIRQRTRVLQQLPPQ